MAWVAAALLILSAQGPPYWGGLVVCLLGATLRFWASGYLHKDNVVSTGGPYRYTRNPLYLGTYLMALGAAAAARQWWLVAGVSVAFFLVYQFTITDEEEKLLGIFGTPYERYLDSVPRFFPRLWPARLEPGPTFDWAVAWKNKAYEAYAAWVALVAALFLRGMS